MSRILTLSWGLPECPRYLLSAPITHAGSLPILPTLCRGGTFVLQQSFDPEAWLATVAAQRIKYTFVVPTMLYVLLDHGGIEGRAASSLETILYGSAPMTPASVAEAWHSFGPVVMTGYHNQPEQTEKALRGGWLHTGDLASCDGTGFYSIVGRLMDVIVSGGFNVSLREIEDVIATAPGVSATAVIGLPHDKWGEAVTAFVVAREGQPVDVQPLLVTIPNKKGPQQVSKAVHVVDELPLTAAGKIDKKLLHAQHKTAN
jgi:acyl-CoA synthetase (AMP-forming)/AMP-acid ligase II